jgi:hypothetical protein
MLPVSCGGIGCEPVSSIAIALPGEAASIRYFVDNTISSTFCSKLMYLSYATDWSGVSVGHPTGALAIFC